MPPPGPLLVLPVDLAAIGDRHPADQEDDPTAIHPDSLIVVDLAARDQHVAVHLADATAAEVALGELVPADVLSLTVLPSRTSPSR